jgi:hypothetical protein
VYDYLSKKTLSELGYRFDGRELSQFEAEYLSLIHGEFSELKRKKREKESKQQRRKT